MGLGVEDGDLVVGIEDGAGAADDGAGLVVLVFVVLLLLLFPPTESSLNTNLFQTTPGSRIASVCLPLWSCCRHTPVLLLLLLLLLLRFCFFFVVDATPSVPLIDETQGQKKRSTMRDVHRFIILLEGARVARHGVRLLR